MLKTTFTGKSRLALVLCLSGLLSFAVTAARADEDGYDGQDPPSRVARLSALDGSVSLQPGGEGDWGAAARNRPVTVGDKIWVDKDARAELQAGQVSIHLGAMSALSFLNLDEKITQIRLAEGSVNFRVRELREGDQYEVDTPNVAFVVREAGAFHIDVNETGDGTLVTVLRGEGEVTAGGRTYNLREGERAEFTGTDDGVEYHPQRVGRDDYDELDRWAAERDSKEERSVSGRYVSHDMVGYGDLDDYGDWNEEPEYGHVWYPRSVAVGWAPYSYGYWNWVGPWGWTWVDYSPWGFAPFHYGRWNYFGGRWGWCPGRAIGYPVYGPAFVGFLGGGFGGGFGVGVGVGWFPLGFGEVYHPWYHAGGRYIRNINIHNTYIRNVNVINNNVSSHNYAYAHNPAAVTATSHNAFVNGQLVNRGNARVTAASLRGATVTNRLNMTPTRQSFTGAVNARARVATPPSFVQNRGVVARTAPAAGAANAPVRTVSPGVSTNGNARMNTRQGQLTTSRPPSAQNNTRPNGSFNNSQSRANSADQPHTNYSNGANTNRSSANYSNRPNSSYSNGGNTNNSNRPDSNYSNRPANNSAPMSSRSDRPNWAGSGANSAANSQGAARANNNRPPTVNNGQRGYSVTPPQRTYSAPQQQRTNSAPPQQRGYAVAPPQQRTYSAAPQQPRQYSAPPRSYSPPPSRGNSAPQHTQSAPSRGSSGPSRSSGGNNSGPHGRGR